LGGHLGVVAEPNPPTSSRREVLPFSRPFPRPVPQHNAALPRQVVAPSARTPKADGTIAGKPNSTRAGTNALAQAPPPLKRVIVSVVGARDLARQDENFADTSDPYVIVRCGKQLKKTKAMADTLNPTWNAEFTFCDVDPTTVLTAEVWDRDQGSRDDPMGMVELPVQNLREPVQLPLQAVVGCGSPTGSISLSCAVWDMADKSYDGSTYTQSIGRSGGATTAAERKKMAMASPKERLAAARKHMMNKAAVAAVELGRVETTRPSKGLDITRVAKGAMKTLEQGVAMDYTGEYLEIMDLRQMREKCKKYKVSMAPEDNTPLSMTLRTRLAEKLLAEKTKLNRYSKWVSGNMADDAVERAADRLHRYEMDTANEEEVHQGDFDCAQVKLADALQEIERDATANCAVCTPCTACTTACMRCALQGVG
jgi:hypothetical protein